MQDWLIRRAFGSTDTFAPPFPLRLLGRFPLLGRIPVRLIGIGVRPEHVEAPASRPVERPTPG
jgi:hypothetical protein